MAQKYHPLDVRYKGPSTAYRGKPKDLSRVEETILRDDRTVTGRKAAEVWAKPAPPAPPDPAMATAPPPLPLMPTAAPPRRNSGLRVLIGAVILVTIVGANVYVARQYNGLITDVEGTLNAITVDDL